MRYKPFWKRSTMQDLQDPSICGPFPAGHNQFPAGKRDHDPPRRTRSHSVLFQLLVPRKVIGKDHCAHFQCYIEHPD